MTKGELWKGVAIRLITAIVFGVIGGFAIWYALQMVAIFGEGMGVDARSREIYAHSHMVVHVFGAACALAIGIFYHGRNWTLFALALSAIILCGGYGILNMVGFTSTNRVTVAATKDASRNAAERAYQASRSDLMGQIDWLQKTAANEDGRERRRLLSEVDAKRKELSALKPPIPTAETVISDTQASTLAELTGRGSVRQWMLALPIPLAVLVFVAESFSFIFVGHLLAAIVALFAGYVAAARPSIAGTPEGSGGHVKSSDESKPKQDANVIPMRASEAQAASIAATPKVSAGPPRVPAPAPTRHVPLTLQPKSKTLAELLAVQPSWPSQKAIADAMGVSQAKVSRDLKKLKGQRKVEAKRDWRSNTIIARRQGVLHAVI